MKLLNPWAIVLITWLGIAAACVFNSAVLFAVTMSFYLVSIGRVCMYYSKL